MSSASTPSPSCSTAFLIGSNDLTQLTLGVDRDSEIVSFDFDERDPGMPGTNSPRMMTSLRNASRRGARIISFNPLRERALERFQAPQNPVEMITLTSTPISTNIYQVRVGGEGMPHFLLNKAGRHRCD